MNYSEDVDGAAYIIVVHGTWGNDTHDYFSDTNAEEQNYRNIKRFAADYAYKNKCIVKLESIKWNGNLENESRATACVDLSKHVNDIFIKNNNNKVITVAHSHGCNIINMMSHTLVKELDLMIHFACPVRRDNSLELPDNTKKIIYFHSKSDLVAPGGRIPEEKLWKHSAIAVGALLGGAARFISPLFNRPATSKELIFLWGGLAALSVRSLAKEYFYGNNILPIHKDRITIGVNTIINETSIGHSQIPNISELLPEIMEKIDTYGNKDQLLKVKAYSNAYNDPNKTFNVMLDDENSMI